MFYVWHPGTLTSLKLMNHYISGLGWPSTFKSIEKILRKDNYWLRKTNIWHNQLIKAFW